MKAVIAYGSTAAMVLCGLLAVAAGVDLSAAERPNVLLIFVDDLRPMTRDYGHRQMHTPNFDRLAERGVRFENAYCQVPTCGASRASLMTSLYPTVERFPDFLAWAERDAPGYATLPQRFREAGYTTISNGKVFHHQRDTEDRSWSEPAWRPETSGRTYYNEATARFMETQTEVQRPRNGRPRKKVPMFEPGLVDPLETHDGKIAQKTIDDMQRLAGQDAPFFIACGLAKPHMPFYAPASAWEPYPVDGIQLARNRQLPQPPPENLRQVREQFAYAFMTPALDRRLTYNGPDFHKYMRQGYYACVTHADDLVGRMLDKLAELQLDRNTYVVVLGDHGFLLGEHNEWAKNQLLHNALRTAMWISGPGVVKKAAVGSHVEFVDIQPTLCELAAIPYDADALNGRSFANLLRNPSAEHRDNAYTRFKHGDAITTDDFYYVLWQPAQGEEEALLIDRKLDPQGERNVAGQREYASVEAAFREQVLERISQAQRMNTRPVKQAADRPAHAARSDSPQVAQRPLVIEATVEGDGPSGVVVSQGGLRFGYALYFVEGRPAFCVRNGGTLTEIRGERAVSGRVTVKATLDTEAITLQVDGRTVATASSPGLLTEQPVAAYSVGQDAGDPVGDYPGPGSFDGRILSQRLKALD